MFNTFLKNKKGVATVEFTLTVGIFFMVILMFFELARITLISAYLDLSIAEASRLTRLASYQHDFSEKGDFNYQEVFIDNLRKSKFKFNECEDSCNFKVSVDYFDTPTGLADFVEFDEDGNPVENTRSSRKAKLARYSVSYDYKGLVSSVSGLLKDLVQHLVFERRFIMVQEYERD